MLEDPTAVLFATVLHCAVLNGAGKDDHVPRLAGHLDRVGKKVGGIVGVAWPDMGVGPQRRRPVL